MDAYLKRQLRLRLKRAGDAAVGALAVSLLTLLRLVNPDTMANAGGWLMRKIGPLFKENEIARDSLTRAFPEKTLAEIDTILRGVWDNLGRVGAEFAQLDRLWDFDPAHPKRRGRIEFRPVDTERFEHLAHDGKPALIFASHLANWELPAICAATHGMESAVLYRRPNIAAINDWLRKTRAANMGAMISTGLDAPVKLAGKRWADYKRVLTVADTGWFCFIYSLTFGGFVGLDSYLSIFFRDQYHMTKVQAGDLTTIVVIFGSFLRPVGGMLAGGGSPIGVDR